MEQEAKIIFSKLNHSDHLVMLYVNSKITSTEELAEKVQNWKFNNLSIMILIGGPDGIDQKNVKEIAKEKISMSKMTFPHPL